ncbi:DUF3841 domain-containing protein [Clostridium fungisolvens]|uniref:DUF3841 domain-containing protein n=1 Tax=Clostridium fungisolvens TaxID=1604897 RepID=A0A6V8SI50_9CLOT|nr:DUF3841 domain-containing protein [Clostridium fungisolvens]GFP76416.1 hypothetical protein bsdtw1_02518 [Clostridium fungisolvens]
MKLWTIQSESVYTKFKDTGILQADEKFIYKDMIFHYNWMVKQMKKRVGLATSQEIKYPIWAWYQWRGVKQKKPDLRFSGHLERGARGVILELEVEPESVLLSDFDEFNNVLNYGYIADNEEDFDKFYVDLEKSGYCHYDLQRDDKKNDILSKFKLKFYKSWEKVFDLECEKNEEWSGKKENQSIQATMWEVKWNQIVSVKHFIAK